MSDNETPPSLRDVAARAGVGKSTASLALRDSPRLSADTRRRVREAAEALGYRSHAVLRAEMARVRHGGRVAPGQLGTLALLEFNRERPRPTPDCEAPHRLMVEGATARAAGLGYALERHWARDPALPWARLLEILKARGTAGALLYGDLATYRIDEYELRDLACLYLGSQAEPPAFPVVQNNQYRAGWLAGVNLARAGYRRIGLVLHDYVERTTEQRFHRGLEAAWRETRGGAAGGEGRDVPPLMLAKEDDAPGFLAWVDAWRPDAVVGVGERPLRWLEAAGLRVPEDIGYASLDLEWMTRPAAGVRQDHARVGALAAETLIARVSAGQRGPRDDLFTVLVEGRWQDGPTLRAVTTEEQGRARARGERDGAQA